MGVKYFGLTKELPSRLHSLRLEEESGIPGVRVKSVDIGRNTSGEGGFLVWL